METPHPSEMPLTETYNQVREQWDACERALTDYARHRVDKSTVASAIHSHMAVVPPFIESYLAGDPDMPISAICEINHTLLRLHDQTFKQIASSQGLSDEGFTFANEETITEDARAFMGKIEDYEESHSPEETLRYITACLHAAIYRRVRDNTGVLFASIAAKRVEHLKEQARSVRQAAIGAMLGFSAHALLRRHHR